jgi:outer membrane protein TolC
MKLSNQESKSEIQQDEQVKSLQVKDRRRKEIPRLDISVDAVRSKFFKVTKKALPFCRD